MRLTEARILTILAVHLENAAPQGGSPSAEATGGRDEDTGDGGGLERTA